jgi:predicted branched-subunit amino acid permease
LPMPTVPAVDRTELLAGHRAAVPLLMGVLPFGLVTGVALIANGIAPLPAMALSVLVFAGASMIAAGQLLAAGTPVAMILLAVLFINLRHVMYSASLRSQYAGLPLRVRAAIGYLLADNVYALAISRHAEHPGAKGAVPFYFGAALTIWTGWQLSVAAGIVLGAGLPAAWKLEFAAPLAFVAITIPLLRDRAMVIAALAAGVTVVLAHGLPFRLGLPLAGVVGIVAGVLSEGRRT